MSEILVFARSPGYYHDARFRELAKLLKIKVIFQFKTPKFSQLQSSGPIDYCAEFIADTKEEYLLAASNSFVEKRVLSELKKFRGVAIVISGWASLESLVVINNKNNYKYKVMLMSESSEIDAKRSKIKEYIKSAVVKSCDYGLVGGECHSQYLGKLGLANARIMNGYDSVDNCYFRKTKNNSEWHQRYTKKNVTQYILASGRFIEKKNFLTLIEAFKEFCEANNDVPYLLIAGDGNLRPLLEKKAHGCEKIILLGYVAYEDLPSMYKNARFFIHPAIVEQWGLVINEAIASGCLVLSSNKVGAAREILQKDFPELTFDPNLSDIVKKLKWAIELNNKQIKGYKNQLESRVCSYDVKIFGLNIKKLIELNYERRRVSLINMIIIKLLILVYKCGEPESVS